jgi:hypothetical protein
VILALIEGISIGVQRVLLPMYEKQAVQQGMVIDMLDPPVDPLMRYRRSPTDTPNPIPSALHSGVTSQTLPGLSSGGFDLSSVSTFDSTGDDWQNSNEKPNASTESKKSWWS